MDYTPWNAWRESLSDDVWEQVLAWVNDKDRDVAQGEVADALSRCPVIPYAWIEDPRRVIVAQDLRTFAAEWKGHPRP